MSDFALGLVAGMPLGAVLFVVGVLASTVFVTWGPGR
jgi:hypothetical protein